MYYLKARLARLLQGYRIGLREGNSLLPLFVKKNMVLCFSKWKENGMWDTLPDAVTQAGVADDSF
jgi:hypothetical protein